MRLLLIHSDYIEYEAKKKTRMAEPESESVLADAQAEALTVFCAVESVDEEDPENVVMQAVAGRSTRRG